MSRTVGIPVAIAVRLILDGRIKSRGVLRPTLPEVYEPALVLLDKEGIHFRETRREFYRSSRPADFEVTIPGPLTHATPILFPSNH
jgi:hypothetical protein